jgi:hypothetical protein
MNATDLERDVFELILFKVAIANQDGDRVAEFLSFAGIEPGTSLPRNTLIKLSIYRRLRLWEEIGLTSGSAVELPTAHAVFADIVGELEGEPPRFEIGALWRRVDTFAFERLTWPQSGAPTFMLDDRSDSSDTLECIAELLWNYRHLAEAGSSSVLASPTANVEDESAETTAGASTASSPSAD